MTQRQLDLAVARRTGESLHTIRQLGFRPLRPGPPIVHDTPSLRQPAAIASRHREPGAPAPRRAR